MTAYPRGHASRQDASFLNRVTKITAEDTAVAMPDTLTQVKREVNVLDLLEVSDNPSWVTKVAALPVLYRKMFQGSSFDRIRYRYHVYGYQSNLLNEVLFALVQTNYSSKVSGWIRLAASSQSGGEWTPSIVDVLNGGSPIVQTDVDRRAAVGASANSLPTMVFDGTDVHLWPQSPAHSSTAKVGIWLWYRPATVSGIQRLYGVANGVAGSGSNRLQFYANGSTLSCEAYITGADGRSATTPSLTLTAGVWHALYVQYDSSRGGDDNLRIYVNGVLPSLVYANVGAGGTLAALPAATGNALVGAGTDSDTPVQAIANGGMLGPNAYAMVDNLTASEQTAFLNFERPV